MEKLQNAVDLKQVKQKITKIEKKRIEKIIAKKPTKEEVSNFNKNVASQSRKLRGTKLKHYKKTLSLTKEQKEIIIGTLLGDACIPNKRAPNHNYYIKFEQKYTQLEYINHLYHVFKDFIGTGPTLRLIYNTYHTDYGVSCVFSSYSHPAFDFFSKCFYKINQKGR